jgi:hypothetical protein
MRGEGLKKKKRKNIIEENLRICWTKSDGVRREGLN